MRTRALIVDDDQQTCQMIQAILGSAGMDAAYLTDPNAAALHLQTEKADLLFLDLHMPQRGGFGLLQGLRASGINQRTPVVMITGDQDPRVLAKGFEAGASYFLFKPIEMNRLMRVVRATEASVYRERRRFQRIPVSCRAALVCNGERIEGHTVDLSLGGMMMRGDKILEEGTRVNLEVRFPIGGTFIDGRGRVARTFEDGCLGIEFLHLSAKQCERLQQFLLPLILEPAEPPKAKRPVTHK